MNIIRILFLAPVILPLLLLSGCSSPDTQETTVTGSVAPMSNDEGMQISKSESGCYLVNGKQTCDCWYDCKKGHMDCEGMTLPPIHNAVR